jgi:hypothetical protein
MSRSLQMDKVKSTGIRRKQTKDWVLCRTWPRSDTKPLTVCYTTRIECCCQFNIIRSSGMQCPTYTVHSLDVPAVISHYLKLEESNFFQDVIGGRGDWTFNPARAMNLNLSQTGHSRGTFMTHVIMHGVKTPTTTTRIFAVKSNIPYPCRVWNSFITFFVIYLSESTRLNELQAWNRMSARVVAEEIPFYKTSGKNIQINPPTPVSVHRTDN